MRLFLATGNDHKVEEFGRILESAAASVSVHSANEAGGMPPVEETAATFAGNARLKARALAGRVAPADWVMADDSGLEVKGLRGEPGIRSARYAGEDATDARNRAKLIERLAGAEGDARRARFVCVLVLLGPAGQEKIFEGTCSGRILARERGQGGFGYDPLFVPDGHDRTFAEMDRDLKNALSHRARAIAAFVAWLQAR